MHLHDQLAAGRHRVAELLVQEGLIGSGRPVADPGAVADPGVAEAGPSLTRGALIQGAGLLGLLGVDAEDDRVVDEVGVLRQELAAGEERLLVQLGIQQEAAVLVGAAGGAFGVYGSGRVRVANRSESRSGAAGGGSAELP
nr:hypothetical protein GCM10020093_038130 [Planobispora longispora]